MKRRKNDFAEEFARAHWPEKRKRGRERFIWFDYVTLYGLPLGALAVAWFFYVDGLSFHDVFTKRGAMLTYMVMAITISVAYFFGRLEWEKREEEFKADHGQHNIDNR